MMKRLHLALAAACCCAAAYAQEPAGASVPGTARDCSTREGNLKARMAELARTREALDQDTARLARETEDMDGARRRAEEKGPDEVAAYNARRAELNARLAAHNARIAALNADVGRFNTESEEVTTRCNQSLRLTGGEEPKLDADERAVLAAAVGDRLGADKGPILLEDHTATFLCSRSLPDVMQFDGCSGLRHRDESPPDVIAKLKRAWPDVSDATLADLLAKGDMRALIDEPLAIPAQQVLRGYGEGGPSERVDASVKVSRAGFDPGRREAVAFVAVRSKERGRSFAGYVRLERKTEGWVVTAHTPVP
jgi:hypothetical protein